MIKILTLLLALSLPLQASQDNDEIPNNKKQHFLKIKNISTIENGKIEVIEFEPSKDLNEYLEEKRRESEHDACFTRGVLSIGTGVLTYYSSSSTGIILPLVFTGFGFYQLYRYYFGYYFDNMQAAGEEKEKED